MPPKFDVYDAYGKVNWQRYRESGLEVATYLTGLIRRHLRGTPDAILEWGCGPGRVIRHMPGLFPFTRIYGTDLNERSVQWCRSHLPYISFYKNELIPPLPFDDNAFDVIYAHSVFTHLSKRRHYEWRDELLRVLKPGGILIVTVNGDTMMKKHLLPVERARYDTGQLVVRGGVAEGKKFFGAYHPPAFIRELFADTEILEHEVDHVHSTLNQDVWVIRA